MRLMNDKRYGASVIGTKGGGMDLDGGECHIHGILVVCG